MYDHATWTAKYRKMRDISDRIDRMRYERKRTLCAEAGLDPNLLGIQPHNAMISADAGKPWPEVDYSKVRALLRVERMPSPSEILSRWDRRVRL
jgi:hypothetical protein